VIRVRDDEPLTFDILYDPGEDEEGDVRDPDENDEDSYPLDAVPVESPLRLPELEKYWDEFIAMF
jgi:hypothetical protein